MIAELLAHLTPLKCVSLVAAIIAFGTGAYAAMKWWQASKVDVDLGYAPPGDSTPGTYRRMGVELPRTMEPVDPVLRQMNETAATWEAMSLSAALNKVAAKWTAVSVGSSVISAIVGAFA